MTKDQGQVEEACRLHDEAGECYSRGKKKKAQSFFLRSLRLLESAEGPYHPDVASVLNSLARCTTTLATIRRQSAFTAAQSASWKTLKATTLIYRIFACDRCATWEGFIAFRGATIRPSLCSNARSTLQKNLSATRASMWQTC
jgi:hypothetical protein